MSETLYYCKLCGRHGFIKRAKHRPPPGVFGLSCPGDFAEISPQSCFACHFQRNGGCADGSIRKHTPYEGCGAWVAFHHPHTPAHLLPPSPATPSLPSVQSPTPTGSQLLAQGCDPIATLGSVTRNQSNAERVAATMPTTTLQKLPPTWHTEAADMLRTNFDAIHNAFLDSTKKAVALGLFLNAIKARGKEDGSIPHGEFLPWCEKNIPEIKYRTFHEYMQLATGVVEFGKLQMCNYRTFALNGQLPEEIDKLISGKTQKQLRLQFHSQPQPVHNPIKPIHPEDVIAAENEQADWMIGRALEALEMIQRDIARPDSTLIPRIPVKRWKELIRTCVAINKAAAPLTRRKLSPLEQKEAAAQDKWDTLAAASRQ